ncbi:uncharacterized protein LOC128749001 [Synchiropus splendidus]|uniref:uncharacterized protein LOC128749001 n=1 Tax=Synchiropus splendidus TaxID=270530 RepID=UPI00237E6B00|nr:uncharacterized protein LOC128749001 [Synchiropus splendidus]
MKHPVMVVVLAAVLSVTGQSGTEVTGILGSSITLQFHFSTTVMDVKSFTIHVRDSQSVSGMKKIAQCDVARRSCSGMEVNDIYIKNNSVFCQISRLTEHQSNIYWATYQSDLRSIDSDEVHLSVLQQSSSPTGQNGKEVTGILGSSITLQFHFSTTMMDVKSFTIHVRDSQSVSGKKKIAECDVARRSCSGMEVNDIYIKNNSVFCQISHLTEHHSNIYWATYKPKARARASDGVHLSVLQQNSSTTDSPQQPETGTSPPVTNKTTESHTNTIMYVAIGGVSAFLLAALVCVIWCLVRSKGRRRSSLTILEPAQAPPVTTTNELPYSLLYFSNRTPSTLELNARMMEYATVQHHTGTLR